MFRGRRLRDALGVRARRGGRRIAPIEPAAPDLGRQALRSEARGVAREGVLFLAGGIAGKAAEFFFRRKLSVELGPSEWGVYSLGLSVMAVASAFVQGGFEQGLAHHVALWRADGRRALGVGRAAFRAVLVLSLLASAALVAAAEPLARILSIEGGAWCLRAFGALVPAVALADLAASGLYGFGEGRAKGLLQDMGAGMLLLVAAYLLSALGTGTPVFVAAHGAVLAAVAVLMVHLLSRRLGGPVWAGDTAGTWRVLLSFSWPLSVRPFLETLPFWLGLFLVGATRGASEAGVFSVALLVASPLRYLQLPMIALYMPLASRFAHGAGEGELERLHRAAARWSAIAVAPAAIFLVLYAGEVLGWAFREEYVAGARALAILAAGIAACALVGPSQTLLVALGRTRLDLANRVPAALATVVLCFVLAPRLGGTGAAIALAAGDILVRYLAAIQVARIRSFLPADPRSLAALALFGASIFALDRAFRAAGLLDSSSGWALLLAAWAAGTIALLAATGALRELAAWRRSGTH
ncbi:MAG: oligosaccharide flippase family protein [Planctomycetes bacterium]|nr:oligosaccharide flippase family protein [Planctomycetota bacterium]